MRQFELFPFDYLSIPGVAKFSKRWCPLGSYIPRNTMSCIIVQQCSRKNCNRKKLTKEENKNFTKPGKTVRNAHQLYTPDAPIL